MSLVAVATRGARLFWALIYILFPMREGGIEVRGRREVRSRVSGVGLGMEKTHAGKEDTMILL